jgi:hypothetical protein
VNALRKDINQWVASYRRDARFSGKQSYRCRPVLWDLECKATRAGGRVRRSMSEGTVAREGADGGDLAQRVCCVGRPKNSLNERDFGVNNSNLCVNVAATRTRL